MSRKLLNELDDFALEHGDDYPLPKQLQYKLWSYVLQDMGMPKLTAEDTFVNDSRNFRTTPHSFMGEFGGVWQFVLDTRWVRNRLDPQGRLHWDNEIILDPTIICQKLVLLNSRVKLQHVDTAQRQLHDNEFNPN